MSLTDRDLFILLLIGLPIAGYVLLAMTRKPRFRKAAAALGAAHVETGWLKPGKIVGSGFNIEAYPASGGGTSRYLTTVKVALRESPSVLAPAIVGESDRFAVNLTGEPPGAFYLKPGFFKKFPDWRCVTITAMQSERVFVTHVSVLRAVELTGDQRERLLRWVSRALVPPAAVWEALTTAKVKTIVIDDRFISTTLRGFVSNPVRLRRIVEVFTQLGR
jgi:hypothetical protein